MSHEGGCHCGSIRITVNDDPVDASECNCSICRRTGALWTCSSPTRVTVCGEGIGYVHGDKCLTLFHCNTCGVITHWTRLTPIMIEWGSICGFLNPVSGQNCRVSISTALAGNRH